MFIVWALLGAVAGAYLGSAAARTQWPPAAGIIAGLLLGAVAFRMFYGSGVTKLDLRGREQGTRHIRKRSPYSGRRCPECTGPNDSLTWQGLTVRHPDEFGDFVRPQMLFVHSYTCIVCGYDWQFVSPLHDPDRPIPNRVY